MHHATTLYDETLAARAQAAHAGHYDTASALDGIAAMIAALEAQARSLRRARHDPLVGAASASR